MASIQIPNLPAAIALSGTELFEGVQSGASVKITLTQIISAALGGATLPVSSGGTGFSTYTIGDILYASASQTFSKLADVATGNAIISGGVGAAPSYGKIGLTTHVDGVLPLANGGTGQSSVLTQYGMIYANTTTSMASTAAGTATQVLHGGTTPSFSAVSLTADVSGTLPVANGGTNITSYAIGDILYASTSGVLSSLADVATGNALISGGVGAAPSYGKVGLTTHVSGILPLVNGGTGASDASTARTNLGAQATITGAATSITSADLTASKALVSDASGKVAVSATTDTELGYVSGVTSSIQTQLNAKQATITGAATTITGSDLTVSRAVVANSSGKIAVSSTTDTEIGYVSGVTSAIQTQLDNKAPLTGTGASGTWGISISGNAATATTATTATTANALNTANNYQVNSLGVGTAASGTAGEIRATNNVTAYYSDDRLKTRLGVIEDPIGKIMALSGFYYEANEVAQAFGYEVKKEVGVSAQQVQAVMPEAVAPAPIDDRYLTVRYERLVPLLIEAIKAQQAQIYDLTAKLGL